MYKPIIEEGNVKQSPFERENYPNLRNFVELSNDVYNDTSKITYGLESRYELIKEQADPETGFFGRAYFDKQTNSVVYAYRGTELNRDTPNIFEKPDFGDIRSNIELSFGRLPSQYNSAREFLTQVQSEIQHTHPDAAVFHTGHSLGGHLGQLMAIENQQPAVVIDAPGIKDQVDNLLEANRINQQSLDLAQSNIYNITGNNNIVNSELGLGMFEPEIGNRISIPNDRSSSFNPASTNPLINTVDHPLSYFMDRINEDGSINVPYSTSQPLLEIPNFANPIERIPLPENSMEGFPHIEILQNDANSEPSLNINTSQTGTEILGTYLTEGGNPEVLNSQNGITNPFQQISEIQNGIESGNDVSLDEVNDPWNDFSEEGVGIGPILDPYELPYEGGVIQDLNSDATNEIFSSTEIGVPYAENLDTSLLDTSGVVEPDDRTNAGVVEVDWYNEFNNSYETDVISDWNNVSDTDFNYSIENEPELAEPNYTDPNHFGTTESINGFNPEGTDSNFLSSDPLYSGFVYGESTVSEADSGTSEYGYIEESVTSINDSVAFTASDYGFGNNEAIVSEEDSLGYNSGTSLSDSDYSSSETTDSSYTAADSYDSETSQSNADYSDSETTDYSYSATNSFESGTSSSDADYSDSETTDYSYSATNSFESGTSSSDADYSDSETTDYSYSATNSFESGTISSDADYSDSVPTDSSYTISDTYDPGTGLSDSDYSASENTDFSYSAPETFNSETSGSDSDYSSSENTDFSDTSPDSSGFTSMESFTSESNYSVSSDYSSYDSYNSGSSDSGTDGITD